MTSPRTSAQRPRTVIRARDIGRTERLVFHTTGAAEPHRESLLQAPIQARRFQLRQVCDRGPDRCFKLHAYGNPNTVR